MLSARLNPKAVSIFSLDELQLEHDRDAADIEDVLKVSFEDAVKLLERYGWSKSNLLDAVAENMLQVHPLAKDEKKVCS